MHRLVLSTHLHAHELQLERLCVLFQQTKAMHPPPGCAPGSINAGQNITLFLQVLKRTAFNLSIASPGLLLKAPRKDDIKAALQVRSIQSNASPLPRPRTHHNSQLSC